MPLARTICRAGRDGPDDGIDGNARRPPAGRRGAASALRRRLTLCVAAAGALLAASVLPAGAFEERDLVQGFLLTVFGAEATDGNGDTASRFVKKFAGPVRYHLVSSSRVDRRKSVRAFVRGLGHAVQNLSFSETDDFAAAHMVLFLVDRADYVATIRATVWGGVNTAFLEMNACSAVLAARRTGIERAFVYLVADETAAGFTHCMVEEITQSLGPANDSGLLPDSIFNDDSRLNAFGLFDWFILNMLYDERIRPGMSEEDVLPLLPAAIAEARRRLPHALSRQRVRQDTRHVTRATLAVPLP